MDISWNFKFALGPHGGGVMKVHALQQEDHRFDPGLEFAFVVLRLWLQDFRFFFFSVVSQQVRFVFHLKGWKSFVAADFVTFLFPSHQDYWHAENLTKDWRSLTSPLELKWLVCRFNNNILRLNAEKHADRRRPYETQNQSSNGHISKTWESWCVGERGRERRREGERAVKQQFSFKTLKKVLNLKK